MNVPASFLTFGACLLTGWLLGFAATDTLTSFSEARPARPVSSKPEPIEAATPEPFSHEKALEKKSETLSASIQNFIDDKDAARGQANMYALFSKFGPNELKLILSQSQWQALPYESSGPFYRVALDRFFTVDPAGALKWINESSAQKSPFIKREGFVAWAYHDPAAALQWLNSSHENNESFLGNAMINAAAEMDPAAALRVAAAGRVDVQNWYMSDVLSTWVQRDPAGALAGVQSLSDAQPHPYRRSPYALAMDTFIEADSKIDPKGSFDLLNLYKDPKDQMIEYNNWGKSVGENDPKLALEISQNMPDGDAKSRLQRGVFESWGDADSNGAWDYANTQMSGPAQAQECVFLVNTMARSSPDATSTLVQAMPSGAAKTAATTQLIVWWSRFDADQASAWLQQQPEDGNKANEAARLMNQWSQNDPAAAEKWLQTLPPRTNAG